MKLTPPPLSGFVILNEAEAAAYLNVSRSWLQKARCHGYGPIYTKLRGNKGGVRYYKSNLDAWAKRNSHGGKEVE